MLKISAGVLLRQLQSLLDLIVLAGAFLLAFLLRFDFVIPPEWLHPMILQLPYVILAQFAILSLIGSNSFIWRYIGLAQVKSFIYAFAGCAVGFILLRFYLPDRAATLRVPLSINVIDALFAFTGVVGLRVARRMFYEGFERRQRSKIHNTTNAQKRPVLLIGAGQAGVMVAKEIEQRGNLDLMVKGFVDDEPSKQKKTVVHKLKVLGTTSELPELVSRYAIDHVVITIAQASRRDIRRIIEICEGIPVRVRIIPGIYEILQGNVEISRIRDLRVDDLLGRDPVQLDERSLSEFLAGKTVMVTGAGGSIGSELVRQLMRFNPATLLLVERSEPALFKIDHELSGIQLEIVPLIADITDETRMRSIFHRYRPDIVLHAAAHKHVPLMEVNAGEAVKNNVLGTCLLGDLAGESGVSAFVLISTDKAVRASSIMGASKRASELVVQDLNRRYETRYVAVRFGNVIGSAGSVIPIFRDQIAAGGPVTVTHPEMTRYFMTIPEAAQLVLQAGSMGNGGEIFVLDMGEPVRILDLAKETIRLSGLRPFEDIDIVFTGIRAGEKLSEELEMTDEHLSRTRHPKIFIGNIAAYPAEEVRHMLDCLAVHSRNGLEKELRESLGQLLPEVCLDGNEPVSQVQTQSAIGR
jgi:FlaA1/EpsC-like NDP-sugar epimerase